jgi:hypothetical protein
LREAHGEAQPLRQGRPGASWPSEMRCVEHSTVARFRAVEKLKKVLKKYWANVLNMIEKLFSKANAFEY